MSHHRIGIIPLTVAILVLASTILTVSQVFAAPAGITIDVFPGTNAITNALAAAHSGDLLNIHKGRYPEAITISKNFITLRSAGDGTVTIDGRCQHNDIIRVRADGVTLDGLRVVGAGGGSFPAEIDFSPPVNGHNRGPLSGAVKNSVVHDTCDAEYGINVFRSGAIEISNNKADGFDDSGIYIGQITSVPSGRLVALGNEVFGNDIGIIVEYSYGVNLRIANNNVHNNSADGILSHWSLGVRYTGNTSTNNAGSGLRIDTHSANNVVRNNTLNGNGLIDLVNDGGGTNCFSGNTAGSTSGTLNPCP